MHSPIVLLLVLAACAAPSAADAPRARVGAAHLADLDGDGDLDRVELDFDVLVVHEQQGGGAVVHRFPPAASGEDEHTDLELLDVDEDGDLDVLAVGENNLHGRDCALVSWDNRGPGHFVWSRLSAGAYGWPCEDLALGDVDGDGRLDALAAELLDGRVFTFTAAAGFAEVALPGLTGGCPDFTRALDLADVDADGRDDLVCGAQPPPGASLHVAVLRPGRAPRELLAGLSLLAAGPARWLDVDADGDVDLAVEVTTPSGRLGLAARNQAGELGGLLPWSP